MTAQPITSISQVPCPPACKREDKGCLTEAGNRYGCDTCKIFFYSTIGGYKLTPQDMYDLLHGDRIAPVKNEKGEDVIIDGRPVMARWTDFHEFTSKQGKKYTASLAFEPGTNWKIIRRFPEKAPVEPTGRLCPKCQEEGRSGQLVIRSKRDSEEKFIACTAYPDCKYTEQYAPFMVKVEEVTKSE